MEIPQPQLLAAPHDQNREGCDDDTHCRQHDHVAEQMGAESSGDHDAVGVDEVGHRQHVADRSEEGGQHRGRIEPAGRGELHDQRHEQQ